MNEPYDIIVVGSGPAGLKAAAVAGERTSGRVLLIDDNPWPGGQIWRNRGRDMPAGARQCMTAVEASGRVEFLGGSRVVAAIAEKRLLVETPNGPRNVGYGSLILATGGRERFVAFPGWTLPGVMGAGGIQALVKGGLVVAKKRVVLAGTGPLLLAVADLLRKHGARVVIILEQTPKARVRQFAFRLLGMPGKLVAGVMLKLRLLRVPYRTDAWVERAEGDGAGLKVTARVGGKVKELGCDYLACGFHLIGNTELAALLGCEVVGGNVRVNERQETTVSGVFAAGELTGVGGVEKSLLEGEVAAIAATGGEVGHLRGAVVKGRRFAERLGEAFALRPELKGLAEESTIVCRCEDVRLGQVKGCAGHRDAKLQTRCGMGACQGRVCGPILEQLFGGEGNVVRPPVLPVAIGTLAAGGELMEPT